MKNIVKYIILAAIMLAGIASCKDPGSIFEEYRVPNGLFYPGPVVNAFARSGDGQVEIVWETGSNPHVVLTRIFWNNYTDTIEVPITPDMETVRQIIAPLR